MKCNKKYLLNFFVELCRYTWQLKFNIEHTLKICDYDEKQQHVLHTL